MIIRTLVLFYAAMFVALGLIGVTIDSAGWPALIIALILFVGALIVRRRHARTRQ